MNATARPGMHIANKLISALAAFVLSAVFGQVWEALQARWDFWQTTAAFAAILFASMAVVNLVLKRMDLTVWSIWSAIEYAVRQAPYVIRSAIAGEPSRGDDGRMYDSKSAYLRARARKATSLQVDYGVHWRDRSSPHPFRVSWIASTSDVVAAELGPPHRYRCLATGITRTEADQRMSGYGYVSSTTHDLRWVQRRLAGWTVPLPPKAAVLKRADATYNASVKRDLERRLSGAKRPKTGAYHGIRNGGETLVVTVDHHGSHPLYHQVLYSPTGLSWGYSGSGPTDLARSILADRLGYPPNMMVTDKFLEEVVEPLDASGFILTYADVDKWISNTKPHLAEDPFAAL